MKREPSRSRYLSEGRNAGREEDEEDKEGIDGMTEQERQTTIGEKGGRIKGCRG